MPTVYDITRRETFENLSEVWLREVEMYCTVPACVKMVVGNKLDREEHRAVTRAEGQAFARQHGTLFLECSAKSRVGVQARGSRPLSFLTPFRDDIRPD